jgi:hypothetical protein
VHTRQYSYASPWIALVASWNKAEIKATALLAHWLMLWRREGRRRGRMSAENQACSQGSSPRASGQHHGLVSPSAWLGAGVGGRSDVKTHSFCWAAENFSISLKSFYVLRNKTFNHKKWYRMTIENLGKL